MPSVWQIAMAGASVFVTSCHAGSPWSLQMLSGIMSRQQGIVSSGKASSTLEVGVLALSMQAAIDYYPDQQVNLTPYLDKSLDIVSTSLLNSTSDSKMPLDRFSIANALNRKQSHTLLSSKESQALQSLDQSFLLQSRNAEGGLWYYAAYPQWSYLDGMFSVLPYMATMKSPNLTDIDLQLSLLYSHDYQKNSGLLVHGYDESKTAPWADPVTGASPFVWGRSLGWYLVGLVQTFEIICDCDSGNLGRDQKSLLCWKIQSIFTELCTSLVHFADPQSGAWWDLTALPGEPGNYLESSSTVLFILSFLKGSRLNIIKAKGHGGTENPPFVEAAKKAFEYTTQNFVIDYGNGTIGFNKTVSVSSLNSTASYDYYTNVPINVNSLLGEAMFVMAALEMERLDG
jgi:rhamnogalacturonyl hydrolase YesR